MGTENTEENTYVWNFQTQLEKIGAICDSWSHRTLSLNGKVIVANALLISLLQYPSSVTYTPPRVAKEYRKIVSRFLWDNKNPKIAYTSVIQTIDQGGLKLMDLEIRTKVNILQWFRRLIKDPMMHTGKALCHVLGTDNLAQFLNYRAPSDLMPTEGFRFYSEMMKLWKQYRNFEPVTEQAVRKESIWYNNFLMPGLFSQQLQRWQEQGIETVGDVCHEEEDRTLSHTEIESKYRIPCTFLEALSLRVGIPLHWRQLITSGWRPAPGDEGLELKLDQNAPEDLSLLSPKRMYVKLLSRNYKPNIALQRWKDGDEGVHIRDHEEWSDICSRVFCTTRETKIQSLQYKISHRVIPCNVFLKRLRISDSDLCNYCQAKDSVPHFFFTCEVVKPFWKTVASWFSSADDLYLHHLSTKEFIFGLPKNYHRSNIINPILAYVRSYIHRQKLFHGGKLDPIQWLREFREKLKAKQWICRKLRKRKHFNKWERILHELG